MNLRGTWNGVYSYSSARLPHAVPFELTVETEMGGAFEGIVRDDVAKGGHPELGLVRGTIRGDDYIAFKKAMPSPFVSLPNGELRVMKGSPYTIYYEGVADGDDEFHGTWTIRFGLVFMKWAFYLRFPTSGRWSMTRERTQNA